MPLDVIMPALGMAQDTGRIVNWHKQPGDAVSEGDVLFEVETDKATMEVEAQGDGFLTDVTANAGTDVPVGTVIACISESAQDTSGQKADASDAPAKTGDSATPQDTDDDLPVGHTVIMPTLGMAQDTGLLVAWHKAAGDAVAEDEILFEVETDKSTVEVNAGADGYIAAVLAAQGESVPVGQTIAIITSEAPANPITRNAAQAAAQVADPALAPSAPAEPLASPAPKVKPGQQRADGRILASPKMRRLAKEAGLDLGRLVAAGHPQPFHVKDLAALKAVCQEPLSQTRQAPASNGGRLTATVAKEGFGDFAAWAAQDAGLTDGKALLAGFCAASLGKDAVVTVEGFGQSDTYAAKPDLGLTTVTQDAPTLCLRDLRFTTIDVVHAGPEDTPVLTLTRQGAGLGITLEYAGDQLTAAEAISLLSNFAGRLEQPLRHLL